jgi:hypothetical protein
MRYLERSSKNTNSKNIIKFIKNGIWIPCMHFFIFYSCIKHRFFKINTDEKSILCLNTTEVEIKQSFFFSTVVILKIYTVNYYFWFGHLLHQKYYWIKHFVRFTDTGHIISVIYVFYPQILPVAFNTHFVITFGYWIGKLLLSLNDVDVLYNKEIIKWITNCWSYSTHGLPLILFTNEIIQNFDGNNYFSFTSLIYSYLWIYGWLFFIYFPWRYFTKDPIYFVLSNESPRKNKIIFILFIHLLYIISNIIGYTITSMKSTSVNEIY